MKKGVKITLITIACLLTAIVIIALSCASFAHRIDDDTKPSEQLSYWMSNIRGDALLKDVVIPGSHDAGATDMMWMARTQDRDIADQLACGTRYFDLRVGIKKGELRIFHGPIYSLKFNDVMTQVRDFLDANPSETIILDFQQFSKSEISPDVLAVVNEYLKDKFVVNDSDKSDMEFIDSLTLDDARGKCLVYWGEYDGTDANDNVFLRDNNGGTRGGSSLHSYYTREWNYYYSSKKYIDKAVPAYIDMYKRQASGLFVLQCQLTDGAFVVGPRFRESGHEANMNSYVSALAQSSDLQYINIVMRDFINPKKNCYTLRLNLAKDLVKAENIAAYTQMLDEFLA